MPSDTHFHVLGNLDAKFPCASSGLGFLPYSFSKGVAVGGVEGEHEPSIPIVALARWQTSRATMRRSRHLQIELDLPRKPLPRTRLNLLCFDGRLVTTAASAGRRPRVKHRNNQQQNTKRMRALVP